MTKPSLFTLLEGTPNSSRVVAVVPAAAGWSLLTLCEDLDAPKGAALTEGDFLRTSVIAWGIDDVGGVVPIECDGARHEGAYYIQSPDGRITDPAIGWFDSMDDMLSSLNARRVGQ